MLKGPIPDQYLMDILSEKYPKGMNWIDIINEWPETHGLAENPEEKSFYFFKKELSQQ